MNAVTTNWNARAFSNSMCTFFVGQDLETVRLRMPVVMRFG